MRITFNKQLDYSFSWDNKFIDFDVNIICRKDLIPRGREQLYKIIEKFTNEINKEFIERTNTFQTLFNTEIEIYIYKPLFFTKTKKEIEAAMWFKMIGFEKDKVVGCNYVYEKQYYIKDEVNNKYIKHTYDKYNSKYLGKNLT